MTDTERYLDANQEQYVDEFCDLLRFPSLSADPARSADMIDAANWIANRMGRAGIENVRLLAPAAQPALYGDWLHAPAGAPTVLIYGHYDVQPADPLDAWDSPPFDPSVRDGRVYARGASDMKGNLLLPIIAFEALRQTGSGPTANIKFLFEGQEEIGSPDLARLVRTYRDLLACDLIVSADGGQIGEERPTIWLSVRGVMALQVDIVGPRVDLHSGLYGGAVQNPLNALVELLAGLHDTHGRIAVEGFYDDVAPLSDDERERLAAVPLTEDEIVARTGAPKLFGEPGYTFFERTTVRPSLDINGLWGGYSGAGMKTVIASEGHAKITCRLVANQSPEKIAALLRRHFETHAPEAVEVKLTIHDAAAMPYEVPADHPGVALAAGVLRELYGAEPVYMRSGGSIPIFGPFRRELGAECVTFGFSLEDECIHSPNEFYRLASFRRGQSAYVRLLRALGGFHSAAA